MDQSQSSVSAILLAAGESRRMGEFKQLLKVGGTSFVERCVDALLASRSREVIVVTGHRARDVEAALEGRRVKFVHNADYSEGMSSSIKSGVRSVSPGSRACLVALVDQPLVTEAIVDQLIRAYEKNPAMIVIPTCDGRRGHPVILDLSLQAEVMTLNPRRGLREVVNRYTDKTNLVEVGDQAILLDFDLPEQYQSLRADG